MSIELQSLKSSLEQEINGIKEQEDLQKKLDQVRAKIYELDDKNFANKLEDIKAKVTKIFQDLNFEFSSRSLPENTEEHTFSYSSFVLKFIFPNPSQGFFGCRSVIEVHVSQGSKKQEYSMRILEKREQSLNTEKLPLPERIEALEKYLSSYTAKNYDLSTVNEASRQHSLLATDLDQFTDHIDVIVKNFKK